MIDLHFWTTPNGYKVLIFLEEAGIDYRIAPVNISAGAQFAPAFLTISPNNRMPAIVDHEPLGGGAPLSVFESGAILWYLAEKTGRFLASDVRSRTDAHVWLMWQMSGFGPMLGQNHHFSHYADTKIPYAIERYQKETGRLYGVLNQRLAGRDHIIDDYSLVDMAVYPWSRLWERQGIDIDAFPDVKRWMQTMDARPAVRRAYELGATINTTPTVTAASKAVLFGQGPRQH